MRSTDGKKKLIEGEWVNDTVKFLKDLPWIWTEKFDGTNTRVYWDGHRVTFGGRTDNANIQTNVMNLLVKRFGGQEIEGLFEQKFGEKEVILFGETYGYKVNGNPYKMNEVDFVLFDVMIVGNYQSRGSVEDIALYFGINIVPILCYATIEEAVAFVKTKPSSSVNHVVVMEGLVGKPMCELKDRCEKRMIVKVKVRDFE